MPAAASTALPAPAHQVSAALVALSRDTDGAQHMTLRLQPPELGQLEIRIERPENAPTRVDITVERPDTMTLLLRDQPQLQRALDQAGLPAEGRSLTLHVAAPEHAALAAGGHDGMAGNASAGQGGGNGTGLRTGRQDAANDDAEPDPDETPSPLPRPRWLRAGLDITA